MREVLLRAVLGAATQVSVRVIPACDIDRNGLHRSNLWGLRAVLTDLAPRAEACLVDGFRLGPAGAAAQRRRRRRHEERRDRGRLDRRQGDARPDHAAARRALPALRLLAPRRLHHAGALGGGARARAVRAAPAVVRRQVLRGASSSSRLTPRRERGRAAGALALPPARLPHPRHERPGGPQRARPDRPARPRAHVRRGEAADRAAASAARSARSTRRSGGACAARRRSGSRATRRPPDVRVGFEVVAVEGGRLVSGIPTSLIEELSRR